MSPAHGRPGEVQGTTQGPFHNDKVSHSQELRHTQLVARAAVLLGPTGLLGRDEGLVTPLMTLQAEPGVQRTGAQAAKHAALGMRAGVPSVAQDKEVPRKRAVWGAWPSCSNCTHGLVDLASCGGTHCEALIAILQHGQGILWHHWLALGGSDWAALDGRRHGALGGQQLGLLRRAAQELHSARVEVIDAALDLQVPFAHQVAQWHRELQEDGVEDVHLHRMSDELGLLDPLGPSPRWLAAPLQPSPALSGLESLRSSGRRHTACAPAPGPAGRPTCRRRTPSCQQCSLLPQQQWEICHSARVLLKLCHAQSSHSYLDHRAA